MAARINIGFSVELSSDYSAVCLENHRSPLYIVTYTLLRLFCIYQYLIHPVPSSKVDIPAPIFSTFDWKHLSIWGFLLLSLTTVWEFLHTSLSNSAIPHFWGGSPAPLFSTFSCPKYNFTSNKLGFKCTASVHVWVIYKQISNKINNEIRNM